MICVKCSHFTANASQTLVTRNFSNISSRLRFLYNDPVGSELSFISVIRPYYFPLLLVHPLPTFFWSLLRTKFTIHFLFSFSLHSRRTYRTFPSSALFSILNRSFFSYQLSQEAYLPPFLSNCFLFHFVSTPLFRCLRPSF